MSKRKQSFDEWFIAQYGKRPVKFQKQEALLAELYKARETVEHVQSQFAKCETWDRQYDAALKAHMRNPAQGKGE